MSTSKPLTVIDVVRENIRIRHYSLRTEKTYIGWIRRYIAFCGRRHPRDLGTNEITTFLTHLAVDRKVSASTQNQALQSLLFLYRDVLQMDLPDIGQVVRASKPARLPVVLTRDEVQRVFVQLEGRARLIVGLLYGSGLRLAEGLSLRVKDLDLERRELMVRHGKGGKDRVTVIPEQIITPLADHLRALNAWFLRERQVNAPGVSLPDALKRKYPGAHIAWSLAVGVPFPLILQGSLRWLRGTPSRASENRPANSSAGAGAGGDCEAGRLPHIPALLRHPYARIGLRHPVGPGVAGSFGRENHHDLHPRPEPGRPRGEEPAGRADLTLLEPRI